MTQAMDTAKLAGGTGRTWDDWVAWIDSIDGRTLSHKEIAVSVGERLNFDQRSTDKVAIGVGHAKLAHESEVERWKPSWRSVLADFANTQAGK